QTCALPISLQHIPFYLSRDTPHNTFHHNLPFSTAICGNLRQYVCNMSAICLQYPQCPRPLPSPRNSTNFHRKDNSTPPPEPVCTQHHTYPIPVLYLLCAC